MSVFMVSVYYKLSNKKVGFCAEPINCLTIGHRSTNIDHYVTVNSAKYFTPALDVVFAKYLDHLSMLNDDVVVMSLVRALWEDIDLVISILVIFPVDSLAFVVADAAIVATTVPPWRVPQSRVGLAVAARHNVTAASACWVHCVHTLSGLGRDASRRTKKAE